MAFRLLAARRGLYVAGATTAAAACRYRVARLDEGEAAAPPKPPGIYKDADFDPSGIEDVAALAAQRLSKSDLQYKKQESLDKQAEEKKTPGRVPGREQAGGPAGAPVPAPGDGGDAEKKAGGISKERSL